MVIEILALHRGWGWALNCFGSLCRCPIHGYGFYNPRGRMPRVRACAMVEEAAEGRFHYVEDASAYVKLCALMRHSSNTHAFTYHLDIIVRYIILLKYVIISS